MQQYQRNVGYLLSQGLTPLGILQIWLQRAALLIEPIRKLHSEVLALRQANRSLQVCTSHCLGLRICLLKLSLQGA